MTRDLLPASGKRLLAVLVAAVALGLCFAPSSFAAYDFTQPVTSPEATQAGPGGMATGDIDNDGDPDVVASSIFTTNVTSLINNGAGDFTATAVAAGAANIDVGLGKFDSDNLLDLAVLYPLTGAGQVGNPGLVLLFKGNGNGTFTFLGGNAASTTPIRSANLAIGNFNNDSFSDVAVVARNNVTNGDNAPLGQVSVHIGAGGDLFTQATPAQTLTIGQGATDIQVGNFDGKVNGGAPDLVASNGVSNSVSFIQGTGAGPTYFNAPASVPTTVSPAFLDVGNLNGDANLDVVAGVTNSNPSAVRTMFGNGSGGFPTQTTVTAATTTTGVVPEQVIAKDFEGDGDLDLAVANAQRAVAPANTATSVSHLSNNGTGTFTINAASPELNVGANGTLTYGLVAADYNTSAAAGGTNDLVVSDAFSSPGTAPVLLNTVAAPGVASTDLAITKTATPVVNATQNITYTLKVENNGPSDATGVTVTDALPAGTSFVSAEAPCSHSAGTVTCALGVMKHGASTARQIVVNATGSVTGPIDNTATVTGGQADPVSVNNSSTATTIVNPTADLSIDKEDGGATPNAGENFTYTLTVANTGPNDATSVEATDTLPNGLTFAGSTDNCSAVGQLVTCDFDTVTANAPAESQSFTVTTDGQAPPSVSNMATVAGAENDPVAANNMDTEVTAVGASADLSIDKEDGGATPNAGENFTYTLTVANTGPNDATSVEATDTLPNGLTFAGSTDNCSAVGQLVTCDFDTVTANAPAESQSFTVTTDGQAPPSVSNMATVAGAENDPVAANNMDTEVTAVGASADLSIDKEDGGATPNAGENFTYTLTVANTGPNDATSVEATDTLPNGLTFAGSTDNCSAVGQLVTCDFDTVTANAPAESQSFTVTTDGQAPPSVSNMATVAGAENDPVAANNMDTEVTAVGASADLSIDKEDGGATPNAGENFTYTLTVANTGPNDATSVEATDTLPNGLTFAGSTDNCSAVGQLVTCDFDTVTANAPAESQSFTVTTDGQAPPSVSNMATVAGAENDPVAANNMDTEVTAVGASADLSIDKEDGGATPNAGENFTYTLTVANTGPNDATSVEATDTLPNGLTFAGSTDNCSAVGQLVTCDFDTVTANAPAESQSFTVTTDGQAPPSVSNMATVAGAENDPVAANNMDTEVTAVGASADLSIDKEDGGATPNAGENFTYTLTVANTGPNDATSVEATDTLPNGLTFAGSTDNCSAVGQLVTCDFDTVTANAPAESQSFTVTTSNTAAPQVSNTAEVAGAENDPVPGNNMDTEITNVGLINLSIDKEDGGATPNAGQPITYSLTVGNAGPSQATSVEATDTLPNGLTFAGSTDNCSAVGQLVTCDFDTVAAGVPESQSFTVTTDGQAPPSVSNMATVAGAETESNNVNNADTEITTVNPTANLSISKTDTVDPLSVGQDITYNFIVTNSGPNNATNVLVTDNLPAGLTYKILGSDLDCAAIGQAVTCDFDTVANGNVEAKSIVVTTAAAASPSVNNIATVAGAEFDPATANNTDSETTTVNSTGGAAPGAGGVGGVQSLETTIDRAKKRAKQGKKLRFFFSATIPGSAFQCGVDFNTLTFCSSPKVVKTKKLDPGRHTFTVRAISPEGKIDRSAAVVSFKIKKP